MENSVSQQKPLLFTIKIGRQETELDKIVIDLSFKNITDSTVRILNLFEPIRMFLSANLITEKGEYIDLIGGGGKIDFGPEIVFTYGSIRSGGVFVKKMKLYEMLEGRNLTLPAGKYKLSMAYHNQYGKNCITGWFDSNTIDVVVGGAN
jgi:hypothetical protein